MHRSPNLFHAPDEDGAMFISYGYYRSGGQPVSTPSIELEDRVNAQLTLAKHQ